MDPDQTKFNIQKIQEQSQLLNQNNTILQGQRQQMAAIIQEHSFLDSVDKDSQLVVTEYYYKYIVYLLVAVLLFLLLMKFVLLNGEQQGGSGKSKGILAFNWFFIFILLVVLYLFLHKK